MRNFVGPFLAASVLSLAACGSGSGGNAGDGEVQATNASVEEVAEQVAEAGAGEQFIRPGKWVSTMRFEGMPGLPEATADMMSEGQTFESCLTEDEARKPSERFFSGTDSECRYVNFTMADGKIDATMRCTQDGGTQVMRMEGSYSPDSYTMRLASRLGAGEDADAGVTLRMIIDAERVGECDAASE